MFQKKIELGKVANDELACIYAALILIDDDVSVTSEKISTLLGAAGISVESIWPSLYAKALEGINVRRFLIENMIGGSVDAASAAPVPCDAPPDKAPPTKEAPPSEDEDSDEDFGLSLFD